MAVLSHRGIHDIEACVDVCKIKFVCIRVYSCPFVVLSILACSQRYKAPSAIHKSFMLISGCCIFLCLLLRLLFVFVCSFFWPVAALDETRQIVGAHCPVHWIWQHGPHESIVFPDHASSLLSSIWYGVTNSGTCSPSIVLMMRTWVNLFGFAIF